MIMLFLLMISMELMNGNFLFQFVKKIGKASENSIKYT